MLFIVRLLLIGGSFGVEIFMIDFINVAQMEENAIKHGYILKHTPIIGQETILNLTSELLKGPSTFIKIPII